MTQTLDCAQVRVSLGVYVLGAIDPAERALVDSHLTACRDCRDELAGLAGLPALLAKVSAEDAIKLAGADDEPEPEETEPPAELLGTVLTLTTARRRRRAWRNGVMAAAAAVVVAAGAFAGVHFGTSSPSSGAPNTSAFGSSYGPGGPWETASGLSSAGQGATVMYRQMGWGTELAVKVVGIPIATNCKLWVLESNGTKMLAASWTTDAAENTLWYPGATGVSATNVHAFQISVGDTSTPITVNLR